MIPAPAASGSGPSPFRDEVTRDDVAAVLASLIADSRLDRTILYLANGEVPVEQALSATRRRS